MCRNKLIIHSYALAHPIDQCNGTVRGLARSDCNSNTQTQLHDQGIHLNNSLHALRLIILKKKGTANHEDHRMEQNPVWKVMFYLDFLHFSAIKLYSMCTPWWQCGKDWFRSIERRMSIFKWSQSLKQLMILPQGGNTSPYPITAMDNGGQ